MSGSPALNGQASPSLLLVQDGGTCLEVFDVLALTGNLAQIRSAFLFEVGEELSIRIEQAGTVSDAVARVRAHVGPDDARVTELEISERSASRPTSG